MSKRARSRKKPKGGRTKPHILAYGGVRWVRKLMRTPWFEATLLGRHPGSVAAGGVITNDPFGSRRGRCYRELADVTVVARASATRKANGMRMDIPMAAPGGPRRKTALFDGLSLDATLLTSRYTGLQASEIVLFLGLDEDDAPMRTDEVNALRDYVLRGHRSGLMGKGLFVATNAMSSRNDELFAELLHNETWITRYGAFGMEPLEDPLSPEALVQVAAMPSRRTRTRFGSGLHGALGPQTGVVLPCPDSAQPPHVQETKALQADLVTPAVDGGHDSVSPLVELKRGRFVSGNKVLFGDHVFMDPSQLSPKSLPSTIDLWIPRYGGDDGALEGQDFVDSGESRYHAVGHEIYRIDTGELADFGELGDGKLVRVNPTGAPSFATGQDHVLAVYVSNRGQPAQRDDVVHVLGYIGLANAGGTNNWLPLTPMRIHNSQCVGTDAFNHAHQVDATTPETERTSGEVDVLSARPLALIFHQGMPTTNRTEGHLDATETEDETSGGILRIPVVKTSGFDKEAIFDHLDEKEYDQLMPGWDAGLKENVVSEHVALFKIPHHYTDPGPTGNHFCSYAVVSTRDKDAPPETHLDHVATNTDNDDGEVMWDDPQGLLRNNLTQRNLGGTQ